MVQGLHVMRLFKNDAIAQMQLLHQQGVKVDAIVTDPPYGISRKNNFHTMGNRQGVDFGEWDKDFNPTSWLKPAYDLLNENGSMIIFCGFRQLSTITDALEELGVVALGLQQTSWEERSSVLN